MIKEKAQFPTEFWSLGNYFFERPGQYDSDIVQKRWKDNVPQFIETLKDSLSALNSFTATEIEACFKRTAEDIGIGTGQVMQIFRVCISGVGGGPAIFEMAELLGQKEIISRLENAINKMAWAGYYIGCD